MKTLWYGAVVSFAMAAAFAGGFGSNSAQAAAFTCANSDVAFKTSSGTLNATTCSVLNIANNGTGTYVNALNSAFGSYGTFVYADRTGDPSATLAGGIQITVASTAINSASSGEWTLSWQDTQPAVAPNLPAMIDLAVVFKAAQTEVGYLFDNLLLPANINPITGAYSGDFTIRWKNGGGNNPDLSHIFAGGANLTGVAVPEPMSLALLGTGLIALAVVRRRKSRRVAA